MQDDGVDLPRLVILSEGGRERELEAVRDMEDCRMARENLGSATLARELRNELHDARGCGSLDEKQLTMPWPGRIDVKLSQGRNGRMMCVGKPGRSLTTQGKAAKGKHREIIPSTEKHDIGMASFSGSSRPYAKYLPIVW